MPSTKTLTFLITAGPTIEDIDPVRFISNRATGRMGVELARAALKQRHRVILIHGPISESVQKQVPLSDDLIVVSVRSAAEMHRAVMAQASQANVVVMNAAVADYTVKDASPVKLKKTGAELVLRLTPTVDILAELGRRKSKQPLVLIGFALETGRGRTEAARRKSRVIEARRKLEQKNLDAIVLDTPHAMGAEASDFSVLVDGKAPLELKRASKAEVAAAVVKLGAALTARLRQ